MKYFLALIILSVIIQNILAQDDTMMDIVTPETELPTTSIPDDTTTPEIVTTTSTEVPSTPKPTPKPLSYYSVTEDNITCIMLDGDFVFGVAYVLANNKTNSTVLRLPKPRENPTVTGSCIVNGTQFIKIEWDSNTFTMTFNQTEDHKKWSLLNIKYEIVFDNVSFPNAKEQGKTVDFVAYLSYSPTEFSINNSFKCYSKFEVSNLTATMDSEAYKSAVNMTANKLKFQAYNNVPNKIEFGTNENCEADKIADIVPIAVGLALAALIIIVLIAYIVGRRRRTAPYQSV